MHHVAVQTLMFFPGKVGGVGCLAQKGKGPNSLIFHGGEVTVSLKEHISENNDFKLYIDLSR